METVNTLCKYVEYPAHCTTAKAKKTYKEKILRENPHELYADYVRLNNKKTVNNLIFHTTKVSSWRSVLETHFKYVTKEGIGRGGRLIICKDENLDTDDMILTITYYTKGTVLIQGNEKHLRSFIKAFPSLKLKAEKDSKCDMAEILETEEEEEHELQPPLDITASPFLPNKQLAESLAQLEMDYTEFKELMRSSIGDGNTIQQLREEIQHLKAQSTNSITELRETLKQVQGENHSLRAQMAKLKEDSVSRERALIQQLQSLQDQFSNTSQLPPQCPSTPPSCPATPTSPQPIPSPTPDPGSIKREEHKQHIVLLMDSNRRFLDLQRLFPRHKVTAKPCSTTQHALQLLKREVLGDPQCIVIHTGTNDLHTLKAGTAEALQKVAEKANREFPRSRIVISTLLPRYDTAPHIINGINTEVSRRCATLPNVHLAHNPTISLRDMYDGIHLHEKGVRSFAKALKDAALGRMTITPTYASPARPSPTPPRIPGRMSNSSTWPKHKSPRVTHHSSLLPHPPTTVCAQPPTPSMSQATHSGQVSVSAPQHPPPAKHQQPQVKPRSYAAAAALPEKSELGEIKEMLQTLCSRLLACAQ